MKRLTIRSTLKKYGISLFLAWCLLLLYRSEISTPPLNISPVELLSQTEFPNDCTASGAINQIQSFTIGDLTDYEIFQGYCCFLCLAAVNGGSIAYWWQDFLEDWIDYPQVYIHDPNGDSTLLEPDYSHTTIPFGYVSQWVSEEFITAPLPSDICSILEAFESNYGILCWRTDHMSLIYGAVYNENQGTITYNVLDRSPSGQSHSVSVDSFLQVIQQLYGPYMCCVLFSNS